jgi:hypothetical protein
MHRCPNGIDEYPYVVVEPIVEPRNSMHLTYSSLGDGPKNSYSACEPGSPPHRQPAAQLPHKA